MLSRYVLSFLIGLVALSFDFCKNIPTEPEDVDQYRERIVVTYKRGTVDIVDASLEGVRIHYCLYDPFAEEPIWSEKTQEQIDGNFRVGSIQTTLVVQNIYFGVLKNVLVHTLPDQPRHMVYVVDPKLHRSDPKRWETIQGISIEGAYSLKKESNRLYFKMSRE